MLRVLTLLVVWLAFASKSSQHASMIQAHKLMFDMWGMTVKCDERYALVIPCDLLIPFRVVKIKIKNKK